MRRFTALFGALFLAALLVAPGGAEELRSPVQIKGKGEARARALFSEMGKVLTGPRCVNCHPSTRRPLQDDDGHPHEPPVWGGQFGRGLVGMRCAACHHDSNYEPAGVPGAPNWHLAPASMAWEGMTAGEICEQLKDPSRNGGRPLDAIVKHMAEDPLVGWAWHPGGDRTPPPGSWVRFGSLAKAWLKAGAHCPE